MAGTPEYTLILNSLGRCGSMMLYRALTPLFKFGDWTRYIKPRFEAGIIYKTHDYPPAELIGARVIYLFGDPRNIIISVHEGRVDTAKHYENFGADYNDRDRYMHQDVLGLEKHFDAWYKKQSFPLMTIRYETMYQNVGRISEFLGLDVKLPPRIDRTANWRTHRFKEDLQKTYQPLAQKIAAAEDVKIW